MLLSLYVFQYRRVSSSGGRGKQFFPKCNLRTTLSFPRKSSKKVAEYSMGFETIEFEWTTESRSLMLHQRVDTSGKEVDGRSSIIDTTYSERRESFVRDYTGPHDTTEGEGEGWRMGYSGTQ